MNRSAHVRRSAWVASAALFVSGCLSSSNSPSPTPGADGGSPAGSPDGGVVSDGATPSADGGTGAVSGAEGLYFGSFVGDGGGASTLAILITAGGHYWIWQYATGTVDQGAVGIAASTTSPTAITLTTTSAQASTPSLQASLTIDGTTLTGTLGTGASTQTFQATRASAYTRPAALSDAVGTWASEIYSGSYGEETETITVSSTGALQMVNPLGCTATGTLTPDATFGFYTVSITFQGAACIAGVEGAAGVAILDSSNPGTPQLLTLIVTADGTYDFPTWGVPGNADGG